MAPFLSSRCSERFASLFCAMALTVAVVEVVMVHAAHCPVEPLEGNERISLPPVEFYVSGNLAIDGDGSVMIHRTWAVGLCLATGTDGWQASVPDACASFVTQAENSSHVLDGGRVAFVAQFSDAVCDGVWLYSWNASGVVGAERWMNNGESVELLLRSSSHLATHPHDDSEPGDMGVGRNTTRTDLQLRLRCDETSMDSLLLANATRIEADEAEERVVVQVGTRRVCTPASLNQTTGAPEPPSPPPTAFVAPSISFPSFQNPPSEADVAHNMYTAFMEVGVVPASPGEVVSVINFKLFDAATKRVLLAGLERDFISAIDALAPPHAVGNSSSFPPPVQLWLVPSSAAVESTVQLSVAALLPQRVHEMIALLHANGLLLSTFQRLFNAFISPSGVVQLTSFEQNVFRRRELELDVVDHSRVVPLRRQILTTEEFRSADVGVALERDIAVAAGVSPILVSVRSTARSPIAIPAIAVRVTLELFAVSNIGAGTINDIFLRLPISIPLPQTSLVLQEKRRREFQNLTIDLARALRVDREQPSGRYGVTCGDGCVVPVVLSCGVAFATLCVLYVAFSGETGTEGSSFFDHSVMPSLQQSYNNEGAPSEAQPSALTSATQLGPN